MSYLNRIFRPPSRPSKPSIKFPSIVSIPTGFDVPIVDSVPIIGLNKMGPIKITNDSHRVNPIGMSYWRNINQHFNDPTMMVVLSISDRLTILRIDKVTLNIVNEQLLDIQHTGEGCFFSAHRPNILYIPFDDYMCEYNIDTHEMKTILTTNGYKIWQSHCDYEEKVWSTTYKDSNYEVMGWGVLYTDGQDSKFYELKGQPDECQIDKSGKWLMIKEDNYNRIINTHSDEESIITNEAGALGHSDCGFECALGENDMSQLAGALDQIFFEHGTHINIYHTDIWNMGYVSWTNAPSDYCLITTPTELIKVNVSTEIGTKICDNLTQSQEYEHRPKANLCPNGQFAVWTSYVNGRLDAYLVRI